MPLLGVNLGFDTAGSWNGTKSQGCLRCQSSYYGATFHLGGPSLDVRKHLYLLNSGRGVPRQLCNQQTLPSVPPFIDLHIVSHMKRKLGEATGRFDPMMPSFAATRPHTPGGREDSSGGKKNLKRDPCRVEIVAGTAMEHRR